MWFEKLDETRSSKCLCLDWLWHFSCCTVFDKLKLDVQSAYIQLNLLISLWKLTHIHFAKICQLVMVIAIGQLISKGLFGILNFPKKRMKKFDFTMIQTGYIRSTYFRSFFGRNWRLQKDILKLTDLYLTAAFHNDNYYNAGSKLFALIICFHFYIFKLKEVKLFSYYYNFLSPFSYNVLVHLWRRRVIIPRNHIRNEATTTTTSISNSALLQTSLNYFPIWNPSLKVFFSFDTLLPKCVHDFKDRIIFVENFRNQRTVKLRVSRYSNVVF